MDYKIINDYELHYLIQERNEEAYELMFKKYKPLLDKISRTYYQNYKFQSIEFDDIYQEAMIGLSKAIDTYDENNTALFYSYALLFIKRNVEKFLKESTRYKHQVLNEALSFQQEYGETNQTLEEFICKEEITTMNTAIDSELTKELIDFKYRLENKHAWVYELRINNFSNKEIAQLLDIDYKSVDNSLRSIKEKYNKIYN